MKGLVVSLLFMACVGVMAEPSQVIVVRHAERALEPKADPVLSSEGQQRAVLLADTLARANVQAIITTQYRRTQETAAPLAKRLGIMPTVITTRRGELPEHIAEVVAAVRRNSGVVLVVGHSNTVSNLVAELSGSTPLPLCETSFAHVFVIASATPHLPALQLQYGAPDPVPTHGCQ